VVFFSPLCGRLVGHRKIRVCLQRFLSSDWEEFQVECLLQMQVHAATLSLFVGVSSTLFDFNSTLVAPSPCWLGLSLTLGCVEEFMCVVKVFALLALALASLKMVNALRLCTHQTHTLFV
jgi:hypothetical protein